MQSSPARRSNDESVALRPFHSEWPSCHLRRNPLCRFRRKDRRLSHPDHILANSSRGCCFTTFWPQKVAPEVSARLLRRDRTAVLTGQSFVIVQRGVRRIPDHFRLAVFFGAFFERKSGKRLLVRNTGRSLRSARLKWRASAGGDFGPRGAEAPLPRAG